MGSLLENPLATPDLLLSNPSTADGVPPDISTSLLWAGSCLLQSVGVLLHLPQTTITTAIVILQRFYLLRSFRVYAVIDTCHAALFLSSKLTEAPTKPRSIINATTYLLRVHSPSPISPVKVTDSPNYHVEEFVYYAVRSRLLEHEMEILRTIGFQSWCALPYPLVINYAQTLECLEKDVVRKAFAYLNDGLLAPSMIYLTHQPNALAVAALYLAAREEGSKLPEGWWEVLDVEREELGFVVAVMKGAGQFVEQQVKRWKREAVCIPWDLGALEEELKFRDA